MDNFFIKQVEGKVGLEFRIERELPNGQSIVSATHREEEELEQTQIDLIKESLIQNLEKSLTRTK